MALVDAHYKFIYVDIGAQGRISDGGVFNNCKLSTLLQQKLLHVPEEENLPGLTDSLPYMILADDAFPLRTYIMKPFQRRGLDRRQIIFNYRLSRARRVVENAFGILANRFRIYRTPIILKTTTVTKVVSATVVLHNMLRIRKDATPNATVDFERDDDTNKSTHPSQMAALKPLRAAYATGRRNDDAKVIREMLADYFMGPGSVTWQDTITGYGGEK